MAAKLKKRRRVLRTPDEVMRDIKRCARKRRGRCLTKRYRPTTEKWRFQCENGHQFSISGSHVLYDGAWCKRCENDAIYDRVRTIAEEHGGKCLLKTWRPVAQDWAFECGEGHKFRRSASSILYQEAWCPRCLGRSPGDMLRKIKEAAQSRGGKCTSRKYVRRPAKMSFVCAKGHRWKALGSLVLYNETWCPSCATSPSEDFMIRFEKVLDEQNYVLMSNQLGKLSEKHLFRCAKGHKFEQEPGRLVSNEYRCPTCSYDARRENSLLGLTAAQDRATEYGGECLSTEYVNASQVARWRCAEGHEWETKFTTVIHGGSWCPECWHDLRRANLNREGKWIFQSPQKRKLDLEHCIELAEENGGRCLSIEYINYSEILEWQCARKHEWEASLHTMEQRENFCTECFELERRQEWLERAQNYARENGGKCLSQDWAGSQKKMLWECINGHRFKRTWNNVIQPPFCGKCAEDAAFQSQGRKRLNAIAKKHGGRWIESVYRGIRQRYAFECRNGCRFKATPHVASNSWARQCDCRLKSSEGSRSDTSTLQSGATVR